MDLQPDVWQTHEMKPFKHILFCALVVGLEFSAGSQTAGTEITNGVRTIAVDMIRIKGPRSMAWQDCVGAGRVAEGLRANWRSQLEECHREIGFKYLRMHGLL